MQGETSSLRRILEKYIENSCPWHFFSLFFWNNFVPSLQREKCAQWGEGNIEGCRFFFLVWSAKDVMKTNWRAVTIYPSRCEECIDMEKKNRPSPNPVRPCVSPPLSSFPLVFSLPLPFYLIFLWWKTALWFSLWFNKCKGRIVMRVDFCCRGSWKQHGLNSTDVTWNIKSNTSIFFLLYVSVNRKSTCYRVLSTIFLSFILQV